MTVSQWAVANRGYDRDVLPWQPAIMDALGAGGDVDLMGPAQSGKSEIGLAWWGWTIDHSPADFLICQPDKGMMQDFVVRRLEPMVAKTKALRDALLDRSGADNIFMKRFGGMISSHIWPVAAQFRARPVPRGWLDDYDQIPDDIEGQGSAHGLMASRQTWFEGRSGTFTSSSPAREAGGGIEARVLGGTMEQLHPACPQCGERFKIEFEKHLTFDRSGGPELAEKTAEVHAPCGCVLSPPARLKLLASCAELPNGGFVADFPQAKRRSFAVDGLMSVRSWGSLAREWRQAELAWESRQDESELKAFWNTKGGKNYRSKLAGERKVEADALAKRIEAGFVMGTVPAGCKVLTAQVDVQSNRFEVQVLGFGEGLETWIIDRFAIRVVGEGAGAVPVDPASNPEHWAVLTSTVVQARYALADGSGTTVPILTTAVDTHGEKGVTPNAAAWWRSATALGIQKDRITLVRGGPPSQRWPMIGTWIDEKKAGRGKNIRSGVRLWNVNTAELKSVVEHRLRRTMPGPGYIHFPHGFEFAYLEELTAEEYRGGKWVKMRPRNETLDLMVYGIASIMRPPYAQTRSDMDWVPVAFRVPDQAAESPMPGAGDSATVMPLADAEGVTRTLGRAVGQGVGRAADVVPTVIAKVPAKPATKPARANARVNPFTGRSGGLMKRKG